MADSTITYKNASGTTESQYAYKKGDGSKVPSVLLTDEDGAKIDASNPLPVGDAGGTLSVDDGGGSLTVDNATIGTTADAAVTSDTTGTLSAKLRGLVAILADVWDSANDRLNVLAKSGASDDAAAAGEIYPAAGLYQSTVDEVDAGDVGRLRMTARRAWTTAPDVQVTDVELGWEAESNVKAAAVAWPEWATACNIRVKNSSGVTCSCRVLTFYDGGNSISAQHYDASGDLSNGAHKLFTPFEGGAGASAAIVKVPSLRGNYAGETIQLRLTPASSTTGTATVRFRFYS